jgi:hypothetical protein
VSSTKRNVHLRDRVRVAILMLEERTANGQTGAYVFSIPQP